MNAIAFDEELRRARAHVEQAQIAQAEESYRRVLALAPDNAEALNFLGTRALNAGRNAEGIALFERAVQLDADNPQIGFNLGLAYLASSRLEEAHALFGRLLKAQPKFFIARLHLARTLELLGREQDALTQYFAAIADAQARGRWMSDATTAPLLRDLVQHAIGYANRGRKQLYERLLAPLIERHGAAALARTRRCIQMYLGELPTVYPDARQKPTFLYYPDLPTTPYFARELFPWYGQLEENVAAIREELLAVLSSEKGLEPFLKFHSPEDIAGYLGGEGKPTWDAFFFYRHGKRYDENAARCPRTAALIDALPALIRIRDHSPEVCFSVLTPGSHILPHRGVTNTRSVTHLPLIVPDNCALRVGGETHVWQEGRCVTFDDTFEHEAWNRSECTRVVMLIDVWNPHLTDVEREAVAALVEVIGDFNRAAET